MLCSILIIFLHAAVSHVFYGPGFPGSNALELGFSGSRFFRVQVCRVQVFQSPGFFRVQVFQGPGFSGSTSWVQIWVLGLGPGSGSRVRVQGPGQVLEVAQRCNDL